jgi:hypothetical protein
VFNPRVLSRVSQLTVENYRRAEPRKGRKIQSEEPALEEHGE